LYDNENHYHLQEKIQVIEKPYKYELSAKNIQTNKIMGFHYPSFAAYAENKTI